ncbi:NAD(P)-dependent oxidoreductase [Microlunatus parietis]
MITHGRLLLTGGAGVVAQLLRPLLRDRGEVVLADLRQPPTPPVDGETFLPGDLRDAGYVDQLTEDVDAIVHLGGLASPGADPADLYDVNVGGTATLLEAARRRGVPRLVIASSVHACGGYNSPADWPVHPSWPVRPCCPYGASKGAMEVQARLYADEIADAHVVCLRFALVGHPLTWRPDAGAYLADEDLRTLVTASLETDRRFGSYFGASDGPNPRYDVGPGRELGWQPRVRVSGDGLPGGAPEPQRCRLWLADPDQ